MGLEESNNIFSGAPQDTSLSLKMQWKTFLLIFISVPTALSSSVNDCRGVKYAYSAKGLDQSDVPRQPRQGKTPICII